MKKILVIIVLSIFILHIPVKQLYAETSSKEDSKNTLIITGIILAAGGIWYLISPSIEKNTAIENETKSLLMQADLNMNNGKLIAAASIYTKYLENVRTNNQINWDKNSIDRAEKMLSLIPVKRAEEFEKKGEIYFYANNFINALISFDEYLNIVKNNNQCNWDKYLYDKVITLQKKSFENIANLSYEEISKTDYELDKYVLLLYRFADTEVSEKIYKKILTFITSRSKIITDYSQALADDENRNISSGRWFNKTIAQTFSNSASELSAYGFDGAAEAMAKQSRISEEKSNRKANAKASEYVEDAKLAYVNFLSASINQTQEVFNTNNNFPKKIVLSNSNSKKYLIYAKNIKSEIKNFKNENNLSFLTSLSNEMEKIGNEIEEYHNSNKTINTNEEPTIDKKVTGNILNTQKDSINTKTNDSPAKWILIGVDAALVGWGIYQYLDYKKSADDYNTLHEQINNTTPENYYVLDNAYKKSLDKQNLFLISSSIAGAAILYTVLDAMFIHAAFPVDVAFNYDFKTQTTQLTLRKEF